MKRKTMLLLSLLLILMLAACGKEEQEVETISDVVPPVANEQPVFVLTVALPDDVIEQTYAETSDRHVYQQQDGDYEVVTEILYDVGIEEALRSVTGQSSEQLTVLKTERYSMPEYRTSWYTMGDEGGRINRASILYDGAVCYCVSFSAPEEKAAEVQDRMESVLSSIGLSMEES